MHDDRRLFPILPSKEMEPDDKFMLAPVMGTIWQKPWEYILTHELTPAEGSAFWHGANLVYEAMTKTPPTEKRARDDYTDCNDRCYGEPCIHRVT